MNLDKDFNEVWEEFNKSNGLTKSDQANENMLSSESNIGEDTSENKIDLLNYIKEQIEGTLSHLYYSLLCSSNLILSVKFVFIFW